MVIKGILTPADARLAVDHGAAGVWVSNHGGRQLDRAIASLDALGPIVDAVGDRAEVYLDSGVRDGVDVVTALAIGARAVFLGRPFLYALAVGGEAGLQRPPLACDSRRPRRWRCSGRTRRRARSHHVVGGI